MGTIERKSTIEDGVETVEQLEDRLSDPPGYLVEMMKRLSGDVVVLGVAGKMGPTLARMALRASESAGTKRRVIGVSRFSDAKEQSRLDEQGIETIKADLLDEEALRRLPDAANVIYMAGMKFGSTGNESLTWAMNTHLPALVSRRYGGSRIVAFSTGNVYGLSPVTLGGSTETDAVNPLGEYAMSCLGRERMFEHFSRTMKMPMAIIRLNYACELRYGVLVDLARRVWNGEPIDLAMGCFNVIWQGDANAMSLAALEQATSPPFVLNVSGPELLSVRRVCGQFGELMGKAVEFAGRESGDALLNNAQLSHSLYGYPRVSVGRMMEWIAKWVMAGGAELGKPTHFEARDGKF
jgi:nucleoside-diphosphate-sugar epimerase